MWNLVNAFKRIRYVDPFSRFGLLLKVASLGLTTAAIIPGLVGVALKPTNRRFVLGIQITALSAFLFGYCVHSKALIFVIVPMHLSLFDYNDLSFFSGLLASFPTSRFTYIWCDAALHYRIGLCSLVPFFYALNRGLPHSNSAGTSRFSLSELCSRKGLQDALFSLRHLQLWSIIAITVVLEICEASLTKPATQPGLYIAISHVLLFFPLLAQLLLMNLKIWEREDQVKSVEKSGDLLFPLKTQ